MSKEEQIILAVERDSLFDEKSFNGFIPAKDFDFESKILSNINYMERGHAEKNCAYKQPIGYSLIINPKLNGVFAYRRSSKDKNYGEKRLQGKWSWGIGGHIEKFDGMGNPIRESMRRELKEEVKFEEGSAISDPQILGYINDDSNDVGKVHFGILYFFRTNSSIILPKDFEIEFGEFMTINELEKICEKFEVENWSKIALDALKQNEKEIFVF